MEWRNSSLTRLYVVLAGVWLARRGGCSNISIRSELVRCYCVVHCYFDSLIPIGDGVDSVGVEAKISELSINRIAEQDRGALLVNLESCKQVPKTFGVAGKACRNVPLPGYLVRLGP
jgi:hypothetical protein